MKKILSFLALSATVVLTGCSQQHKPNYDEEIVGAWSALQETRVTNGHTQTIRYDEANPLTFEFHADHSGREYGSQTIQGVQHPFELPFTYRIEEGQLHMTIGGHAFTTEIQQLDASELVLHADVAEAATESTITFRRCAE